MRLAVDRTVWLLVIVVSVSVVCLDAHADERGPFVAGFERFARYGEIEQATAGRLLISELSCVACHPSTLSDLSPKLGPHLDGAAARLNRDWMEAYIAAPHNVKPHSAMPDVLGGRSEQERRAIAKSIAAFLSTQRRLPSEVKGSGLVPVPHEFWDKGDSTHGKELYHRVGCVACHDSDQEQIAAPKSSPVDELINELDADEIAELGLSAAAREVPSVPFSELSAKYTAFGLAHFLLDPNQFRKASRMPALKLSPVEAADLASYLLRKQQASQRENTTDPDEVETGRQLFVQLKCVQCHSAEQVAPKVAAKPLAELNVDGRRGCLSDHPESVDYRLDDEQTEALQAALAAIQQPIATDKQLELQLLAFNCYACHERNGRGGVARFRRDHFETVGGVDLGDEGRLPPPLMGVGRKLQTAWLKNVLLGKKADVRPHLQIRMPTFHAELANRLPELLRVADKAWEQNAMAALDTSAEFIEAGRQLMDVGCVQCHLFGGSALPSVIGVDVRGVGTRVRPEWFREFLSNPSALKARTRMPSFFPDGKSQRPDLLGGDVDRQIAAMWAYLNARGEVALPDKISEARARNYELKPTDKPIVLRTFMQEAGTHAIAVGFPQRVNFAFDAEKICVAVGWRGKFIDAQGTWFTRSAPPAEPLSSDVALLVNTFPFAELTEAKHAWPVDVNAGTLPDNQFTGYRLDAEGVPTFLYRWRDVEVADRIESMDVDGEYGLRRVLKLRNTARTAGAIRLTMLAATGQQLVQVSPESVRSESGLTTTIKGGVGRLRQISGRDEWLLSIEFEGEFTVELQYRW